MSVRLISSLVILFVISCGTAFAKPNSDKVIIVLDASGSMWGQIENDSKIAIAKNVVKDIVKDWDPNIELGLTAYGHRTKGDCDDIESLIEVGPVNTGNFSKILEGIKPVGKTPLTKAVMQAAEELKFTEDKATVILVSDGIETCDLDPCAVAKKLEEKGIDFTAHVVGFDISKPEEEKQLRCLAEGTGGRFMTARDAASLKSSIASAVQEVARVNTGVKLVAVNEPGGKPLDGVYWEVFTAAEGVSSSSVKQGMGSQPRYKLEPGKYIAKVKSLEGQAEANQEFEVKAEESEVVEVVLAAEGVIQLVAVNESGGEPLDGVYWKVFPPKVEGSIEKRGLIVQGDGTRPEYALLPGKYLAEVSSLKGQAVAEKEIEVFAGKKLREEVILAQEGVIQLVAVNESGGEPLDEVFWKVYPPKTEGSIEKGALVVQGNGAKPEYALLPGKYLAEVQSLEGQAVAEKEIEVVAGKKLREEVILAQEGVIQLVAVNESGGEPVDGVFWKVYPPEAPGSMEKGSLVVQGHGAQPEYSLLPGKYLAEVTSLKGQAFAEKEIEVIAGKKLRDEVILAQEGLLQLKAVTENGGQEVSEVFWKVFPWNAPDSIDQPKLVKQGGGATPEYKLLPGKYTVKVTSLKGKAVAQKDVEVLAGKLNKEEVLFPQEGVIELVAVTAAGGEPVSDVYWTLSTIVAADSIEKPKRLHQGGGHSPKYRLLPGKYVAHVKSLKGTATAELEVEILGGKINRQEVIIPAEGAIKLVAVDKAGGAPRTDVYWTLLTLVKPDSIKKPEQIHSGGGATPEYRAEAGKYLARASFRGKGEVEKEVEIVAGKIQQEELVVAEEG